MKNLRVVALAALLAGGCHAAAADTPLIEDEAGFVARCQAEGGFDCAVKWRWADHAGPMAEALLALSDGAEWSPAAAGSLGDLAVTMPGQDRIAFRWQKQGSEGHYDLITALRLRGVTLEPLGCPSYPMYTMGQEKVMVARAEGRAPFVLTVYSRAAPMSAEVGAYEVDADFSGTVPDQAALAAGNYPGGGGRAFAVEPTGWTADCPDPGF